MFITLEGIEGSGKTSQLAHIEAYLRQRGFEPVVTREPGGTAVGEKIRAVLLDPDIEKMTPLTELFLYEADRIEHLEKTIRPALAAGKIVLCDRFFDATIVYQGYGRGLDLQMIQTLHRLILGDDAEAVESRHVLRCQDAHHPRQLLGLTRVYRYDTGMGMCCSQDLNPDHVVEHEIRRVDLGSGCLVPPIYSFHGISNPGMLLH